MARPVGGGTSYEVDFQEVSTIGLESSPVAAALAGLRANEARYFKNKYDHVFTVQPADEASAIIEWVDRILKQERDIVISSRPLEVADVEVENIRWPYIFYESGLAINVLYALGLARPRDGAVLIKTLYAGTPYLDAPIRSIDLLDGGKISWQQTPQGLKIRLPPVADGSFPYALRIRTH